MSSPIYEQVIHLINQLNRAERQQVVRYIQADPTAPHFGEADLQAYFAQREAEGASFESLADAFANPNVEVSEEDLQDYLHEIGTEWEKEIDELLNSD